MKTHGNGDKKKLIWYQIIIVYIYSW
jgi:hypothetical protein